MPKQAKQAKQAERVISKPALKNTEGRLRVFLREYARTGRVVSACETAGIDFSVHYRRLQNDPVYRESFEQAEQRAAQQLEDKVFDMAIADDLQAAIVLLKRFRPNLYRERASIDVHADISVSAALNEARSRVITLESNGTEG